MHASEERHRGPPLSPRNTRWPHDSSCLSHPANSLEYVKAGRRGDNLGPGPGHAPHLYSALKQGVAMA